MKNCKCEKLVAYFERRDGDYNIIYKRCPECTEIYVEKIKYENSPA